MGICPQQFRISTGVYNNPGCSKIPKRERYYHRISLSHYHPAELSLLSAYLSAGAAAVLLGLMDVLMTALSGGICPSKWQTQFVVPGAPASYLHETRISLNVYMLSILLFLVHHEFGKLKTWTRTFGRSSARKKRCMHVGTWCEMIASVTTFWAAVLNVLLIIISNTSLLNPGPGHNLTVLYQNVQGLVELRGLRNESVNMPLDVTKLFEINSYMVTVWIVVTNLVLLVMLSWCHYFDRNPACLYMYRTKKVSASIFSKK